MIADFTNISKSNSVYFGKVCTLRNDNNIATYDYTYFINKPLIIQNDSDVIYKTNYVDNADNNGLVIYSKKVLKNYTSGNYTNPTGS